MKTIKEPAKEVPVVYDVDVVVAGASVTGVFAALGAAKAGAETVLIDRFGSVGGNMGPALIVAGGMASGSPHPDAPHSVGVYPPVFMGIPNEFIGKYASLGGGCVTPFSKCHYPKDANVASYTSFKMLEDYGVHLRLSAYCADPIMEGDTVRGIFVENKSGRQAVKAKVTIDATGDADVARRAGVPSLHPKNEYTLLDGHAPNGIGLRFVVAGVDWKAYHAVIDDMEVDPELLDWSKKTLGEWGSSKEAVVLPYLKAAYDAGDYTPRYMQGIGDKPIEIRLGIHSIATCNEYADDIDDGLAMGGASPERIDVIDVGDGLHVTEIERSLRMAAFEYVHFCKKYMPGFKDAYLLINAPFIGARGGPCIEGEYTLTMDDCRKAKRFDDVIYLYGEFRAVKYTCEQGKCQWVDMPYRVMLPKNVDGLLAAGRCASGKPDTLLRNRMAVKHMGQAAGIAAALSAKQGVSPKDLDVKELQRNLLDAGFYLGDRKRLKELELV